MSTTNPTPENAPRGWQLSSTVRACEAAGRTAGQEYGRAATRAATLARLLRRQARRRFGGENDAGYALLEALECAHVSETLELLGETLLTADSWAHWLAGIPAPPPAPNIPDYARNLEIDLEPAQPSIDSLMHARLIGGGDALILVRMQKWYQPDLDRLQFEEATRLERLHSVRPTIAVILMWPSADGPGITGSYEGRDSAGQPVSFTYTLRRAWEMPPEEALRGLGTMMLAPLGRGARERMPEIIRTIAESLKAHKADERAYNAVWMSVYWGMGMVCTLEEAHAALGDLVPFVQSTSDYLSAKGNSFQEGYAEAAKTEPLTAARDLILRQGNRRFGANPDAEAVLAVIDRFDQLEALATQVLTVADWRALLAPARPADG
jgi:hypothetical protein